MEALLELLLETEMVIRELTFAVWNAAWLESNAAAQPRRH